MTGRFRRTARHLLLWASRPPADGVAQVLSSDGRRHSTIGGHISAWEEQARGGDAGRRPAAEECIAESRSPAHFSGDLSMRDVDLVLGDF